MTDISSTGIFKNKMRILYSSSSMCSNRESMSESFILYHSWVMNLGNKFNTQLCPLACQNHCLSDRQVSLSGREESPSRSPRETIPFLLDLGSHSYDLQIKNKALTGFLAITFPRLQDLWLPSLWEILKGVTPSYFEDYVQSYFGFEKRKHSHHTFHFTWPEMLSSDS